MSAASSTLVLAAGTRTLLSGNAYVFQRAVSATHVLGIWNPLTEDIFIPEDYAFGASETIHFSFEGQNVQMYIPILINS